MSERYYLGVHWGHRRESVDEAAERALRSLASLRELEPELFPGWVVWLDTKEKSLEHPLVEDLDHVRERLRVKRHEPDAPPLPDVDPGGFALELWNGAPAPELTCRFSLTVGVHHGAWNVPAPNDLELLLPLAPRPDLLEPARLAVILARLARDFDADWGTVSTNQHLMAHGANREPGAPLVGWLVFLSAPRGRARTALPPGARAAAVEGGTIYTASDAFDWNASDALRTALDEGKLLAPTGAPPSPAPAAVEGGDAYEAALELAVLAQQLAEKAPRARQRRADDLADAAAALVVKRDAEGVARVSALLDLAHRLGLAGDDDRDALRALLGRVGA
jgi:hypothetical protein